MNTITDSTDSKLKLQLNPPNFGDMLSEFRNSCGCTLLKASRGSGIPAATISRLERGDFTPIVKFSVEQCHEMLQNLCAEYHAESSQLLDLFDHDFATFQAKHKNDAPADYQEVNDANHERLNLSAIVIGGMVLLIILLIAAGWIYQQWTNYRALDDELHIDYTEYAPEPDFPMPRLEIPRN